MQPTLERLTLPPASPLLTVSFVLLSLLMAALFVAAVRDASARVGASPEVTRRRTMRAAAGAVIWMGGTAAAASAGLLGFRAPPTMFVVLALMAAIAVGVTLSRVGRDLAVGLPLAALVGFQGFRVIVEVLLHRAYVEGLMPVQMSYSGLNFDIVSGLTAIAMAVWIVRGRPSPRAVLAWNALGLALLANIVTIALLSAPTPMRIFANEPPNVWVTHAPWVWLPAVLVLCALLGHLLLFRRLAIDAHDRRGPTLRSSRLSSQQAASRSPLPPQRGDP